MMSSTQRLTLHWPIRSWICLSDSVSIGIGSAFPPYTPDSETVPLRRTMSIAEYSALSRSTPAFSCCRCAAITDGSRTGGPLDERRGGRVVGFHADGVDDGVRAAGGGHLADRVAEVVLVLTQVDHLDAALTNALQTFRHEVDADQPVALVGAALFGFSKLYGEVPGGQAQYLWVPQAQFTHIKVPDGPADDRSRTCPTSSPLRGKAWITPPCRTSSPG